MSTVGEFLFIFFFLIVYLLWQHILKSVPKKGSHMPEWNKNKSVLHLNNQFEIVFRDPTVSQEFFFQNNAALRRGLLQKNIYLLER